MAATLPKPAPRTTSTKKGVTALAKAAPLGKRLARRAKTGLEEAAGAAETLAKKHPAVTAGLLLGAGGLVGVAAERALHRDPTVREAVVKAIKRGAASASKRVASAAANGLSASKTGLRRALR